jgi:hypothetical protein
MKTYSVPTRTGKIGRLPLAVRQELNERLANGASHQRLVAWLNENEIVQTHLEDYFERRPITEQNVSDWKQGGFQDWQRGQEARGLVREFLTEAEEVSDEVGPEALLDRVADMVALILLRLFREAAKTESGPTQRRAVLEIARELARLRRVDLQRQRVNLLIEQQRRDTPGGYDIERLEHLEKLQEFEQHWEWIRVRAASLRAEYLAARQDGTLTAERRAEIEEYFMHYADEIHLAKACTLPEDEEEDENENEEEAAPSPAKRRKTKKSQQRKAPKESDPVSPATPEDAVREPVEAAANPE